MLPNQDRNLSKQRLLDLEQMLNKRSFTLRELMDFMFKDIIMGAVIPANFSFS